MLAAAVCHSKALKLIGFTCKPSRSQEEDWTKRVGKPIKIRESSKILNFYEFKLKTAVDVLIASDIRFDKSGDSEKTETEDFNPYGDESTTVETDSDDEEMSEGSDN